MNGYWKEVLLSWRRHQPDLRVCVGTAPAGLDEDWLVNLNIRSRKQDMYYSRRRYPTPWLRLLAQFVRFKPKHLVCYGFSGWTVAACGWRKLGLCRRLTVLWEGSTPGVELRDQKVRQWLRARMLGCADDACSQSEQGAAYLRELGGLSVHVHPWLCIDPETIRPRPSRPDGPTRYLYVGSLERRKGTDFLWEVMRELPGAWELTVIGPTREQLTPPPDPRIRLQPALPPDQLRQTLADHDVFLFPSREDTWGVAPIEAAAAGLQVVTSDQTPSARVRAHWLRLPLQVELWRRALQNLPPQPQARAFESEVYARSAPPWRQTLQRSR